MSTSLKSIIVYYRQLKIKTLIRLRDSAGWSGPLLFAYNKVTFSCVEAQYYIPVHENLVTLHLFSEAIVLVFCLSLYTHTPLMRAAVALAILPAYEGCALLFVDAKRNGTPMCWLIYHTIKQLLTID